MFAKRTLAALAFFFAAAFVRADAMPIFAQRYQMTCGACHSVLPELNTFGTFFRDHGYRLPAPKHGTTVASIRYQIKYDFDPAPRAPRYVPGGVLLSNVDVGAISAFLHYAIGAQGGPSGTYLAYLTRYDAATKSQYRLGLYELPLVHSPGQRLDDLAPYGYEQAHVGLNDLTLAQPRWGIEGEREFGVTRVALSVAFAEFKSAAYGGRPIDTGITTRPQHPEVGVFVRAPFGSAITFTAEALAGARATAPAGRSSFTDAYTRDALGIEAHAHRVSLLAQQWWGVDSNDDGFGSRAGSSGGFVRLRYALGEHAYLGARYDATAAPTAVRDTVIYAATHLGRHVRLLVENRRIQNGRSSVEGALTVGVPWPANY